MRFMKITQKNGEILNTLRMTFKFSFNIFFSKTMNRIFHGLLLSVVFFMQLIAGIMAYARRNDIHEAVHASARQAVLQYKMLRIKKNINKKSNDNKTSVRHISIFSLVTTHIHHHFFCTTLQSQNPPIPSLSFKPN